DIGGEQFRKRKHAIVVAIGCGVGQIELATWQLRKPVAVERRVAAGAAAVDADAEGIAIGIVCARLVPDRLDMFGIIDDDATAERPVGLARRARRRDRYLLRARGIVVDVAVVDIGGFQSRAGVVVG